MNDKLEGMLEAYKNLVEEKDMLPGERAFLAKKKRDLWWEIRQEIKNFPKAGQIRIYRSAHPEKAFEQWVRQRDKIQRLKQEVLTYYGNGKLACVQCGFDDVRALSIDHINGRGNRHRQSILRTSVSFYTWLKTQNYPIGYQTLCMNCQFIKRAERNEQGGYAVEPLDWQSK